MKQIYFSLSALIILFIATSCSMDNNEEPDFTSEVPGIIEKEIDGLKFSFWLSDKDGNETNIFDEEDVKERGFLLNISLTNNGDKNIFIDDTVFSQSFSNVFNAVDNYVGWSCFMVPDIYIVYKIQPGETHYKSIPWGIYDEHINCTMILPAGKYHTSFSKKFTYEYGDNYNLTDIVKTTKTKTIEIPDMLIDFEVK